MKRIAVLSQRIASALVAIVLAGQAGAEPVIFDCVQVGSDNRCTAGDTGLTVEVLDGGDTKAAFVVANDGPGALTIDQVYVEDARGRLVGPPQILNNGSEIEFNSTDTGEPVSGASSIRPALKVDPDLSVSARQPTAVFGINSGESLGLVYAIAGGHNLSDVIDDLEKGRLRFGVRIVDRSGSASGSLIMQAHRSLSDLAANSDPTGSGP